MKKNQTKNNQSAPPKPKPVLQKEKPESFMRFMTKKPQLRELLFLFITLIVVQIVLHALYPVPCWYYDTNNYLQSAEAGGFIGYRPYGYSWFLVFVKKFAPTMFAVYFFQYWLNAIASLFFIFTVKYIFRPGNKWVYYGFILFAVFSPSVLYMTDYIMSDSIFISLTVLWLTSCLWILHNRSITAIVVHMLTFWGLLHTRYSALFYPVFSIAIFFIAFRAKRVLALALSVIPVLIAWQVYSYNKTKMKKLTNVDIFSSFSGWVIANNAAHMIPWIDLKPEDISDPELRTIHTYALELPDSVYIKNGITSHYMWAKEYPYKKYLYKVLQENQMSYLVGWVRTSITFGKYGNMLVKKYPKEFFMHYLLPNTIISLVPPKDFAGEFNTYMIMPSDNKWFVQKPEDYEQPQNMVFHNVFAPLLPALVTIQWACVMIALILVFIFRKRMMLTAGMWPMFFFLVAFILAYMAANIFGAPFMIRYGLPLHSILVLLIFLPLFGLTRKQNSTGEATTA